MLAATKNDAACASRHSRFILGCSVIEQRLLIKGETSEDAYACRAAAGFCMADQTGGARFLEFLSRRSKRSTATHAQTRVKSEPSGCLTSGDISNSAIATFPSRHTRSRNLSTVPLILALGDLPLALVSCEQDSSRSISDRKTPRAIAVASPLQTSEDFLSQRKFLSFVACYWQQTARSASRSAPRSLRVDLLRKVCKVCRAIGVERGRRSHGQSQGKGLSGSATEGSERWPASSFTEDSSVAGVLSPRGPVLIGGRLQVRGLYRQSRVHEAHLMMMLMVVMVMMVLLMTRRRRRIGIPSDGDVHDVDLGRYDGGRRLWRGLYLLRATDRVAASFATPSRPADLTFSHRGAAVPGRRNRSRGRDARRLYDFVPVRFADRRPRQQVIPGEKIIVVSLMLCLKDSYCYERI